MTSPVIGWNPSAKRPDVPFTCLPPMKWVSSVAIKVSSPYVCLAFFGLSPVRVKHYGRCAVPDACVLRAARSAA